MDSERPARPGPGAAGRLWVAWREVGLVYAAIVVVVAAVLGVSPASTANRFILDSSTNLVNLREHPPYVLVVSAFVIPSVWQLWILLPLVWVYGCVQQRLGRAGVIVAAVIGHIERPRTSPTCGPQPPASALPTSPPSTPGSASRPRTIWSHSVAERQT